MNDKCCPRCEHQSILRPRGFSDQAIASLVSWGEMEKKVVGLPLCDDCHSELRDALIENLRVATEKELQIGRAKHNRAS